MGNTKLTDFTTTDEEKNEPAAAQAEISSDNPPAKTGNREDDPVDSDGLDNSDDADANDGSEVSPCPCYEEEHSRDTWKELFGELRDSDLDDTGSPPATEPKCGHVIAYLCEDTGAKISKSTADNYCSALSRFVDYLHNELNTIVCNTKLKDIDRYFKKRTRENRSERTLQKDRAAIVNLYKYISIYRDAESGIRWDIIREEIDPSDYQTKDAMEREGLEKEEVKALYAAIKQGPWTKQEKEGLKSTTDGQEDQKYNPYNLRNKLMVQTGVEVGPRNTDICKLKIEDVDLDKNEITVSNTKSGGEKTYPITSELALLLRHFINSERPKIPHAEEHEYLFPSQKGGRLGENVLGDIVRYAAERAGIQDTMGTVPLTDTQKETLNTNKDERKMRSVTPHALRHTFNNLLDDAGLPLESRAAALDHESLETTRDFYDDDENNYRELMQDLFSGVSLGEF